MAKLPAYFDMYGNLATYKATLPSAALPQTSGAFAHAAPLRPDAAQALAQLGRTRDRAPADDAYERTLGMKGLASSVRVLRIDDDDKHAHSSFASLRATLRLSTVDGDAAPVVEGRLKGAAAIDMLRGGSRNVRLLGGGAGASQKLAPSKSLSGLRTEDISKLLNQK